MSARISAEEMEIYRKSAREREAARCVQLEERNQRAWDKARQAAKILKEEFGASRVFLFGSLLHPQRFHMRSDVDMAGWEIQHYFRAVARLLDLDVDIEFNLVMLEDARPELKARIEGEGLEL